MYHHGKSICIFTQLKICSYKLLHISSCRDNGLKFDFLCLFIPPDDINYIGPYDYLDWFDSLVRHGIFYWLNFMDQYITSRRVRCYVFINICAPQIVTVPSRINSWIRGPRNYEAWLFPKFSKFIIFPQKYPQYKFKLFVKEFIFCRQENYLKFRYILKIF